MVNFDRFKWLITSVENLGIDYYVFGGFAVDGLYGKLNREHHDIDLLIYEKDKERLIEHLTSLDLHGSYHGNGRIWRIEESDLVADILFLNEEEGYIILVGARAETKVPKSLFLKKQLGVINGFEFGIIPLEWLVQSLVYFDNPRDRELLLRFRNKVNNNLIEQIKDISKRDPSHPKLKEYEERRKQLNEAKTI